MKKMVTLYLAFLVFLCLPKFSFPQTQDVSFSNAFKIKPGAYFEYFARDVTWDEKQHTSELNSYIFALNIELEINEGFSVSALAGYTLSNYDSLVFRKLPFSVELDAGDVGGYIFGAEARKSLLYTNSIEFGLYGQFIYHNGKEKNWDIPGLNVSGTLTGKPTWMRAVVGPYFRFTSLRSFTPYLAVFYNNLWGKYEVNQAIQNLKGTEEKELKSKGLIDITVGTILTLSDYFFLKGEVHVMPHSDGMDLGFVAIAAFSF
jgi:hypothetical protein